MTRFPGAAMAARLSMLVLLAAAIMGCQATRDPRPSTTIAPRPALINHLAFFKLQHPEDAQALIDDCDAKLGTIPGVVSYYCGRHLDTGRGRAVDGDYDVGFCVGFDSEADLRAYQTHPNHVEMVTKWRPRWQWIRVHDVMDQTP